MPRIVLAVTGMSCEHCAGRVEKALLAVNGVSSASADYENGRVEVGVGEGHVLDTAACRAAIEKAGYRIAGEDSS